MQYAGFETRGAPATWRVRRGSRRVRRKVAATMPVDYMLYRLNHPDSTYRATGMKPVATSYFNKGNPPRIVLMQSPATGRILYVFFLVSWTI